MEMESPMMPTEPTSRPPTALLAVLAATVLAGCDVPLLPSGGPRSADPSGDPDCRLVAEDAGPGPLRLLYRCQEESVVVVRRGDAGGDGTPSQEELERAEIGGSYHCDSVEDCWDKCPEPSQDGGTTVCSCTAQDGGGFWCDVKHYGPGEDPWGGGGGGGGGAECRDERDALAAEYGDRVNWPCIRFRSSGGTRNFTWEELNGRWAGGNESRHRPFGYVSGTLMLNLQRTRDAYRAPIRLTSGYRCPEGNRWLPNASESSHHIRGHAVDMIGLRKAWTNTEYQDLKVLAFRYGGSLPPGSIYHHCRAAKKGGTCGHLHMNYL